MLKKHAVFSIQVRASVWFLISSFLQKAISSITTPIFTRLLSPEEYGQYDVFNSWYGILSIFVVLRLSSGMFTQGLVKYSEQRSQFASSMQGLALTLVMFWTVVYLLFQNFWNKLFALTTIQMFAMFLMIWTSAVFGFWASEQRVEYHYRSLVAITLFVSVMKPILGIFFVIHAQDKVTARILGLSLVQLVAYIGLFIADMRRGRKYFDAGFWRHALLFNLPLIPHYLSAAVLVGADRIMIKNMVGDGKAGIYGLAYSISLVMTMFNSALMQTLEPWMYKKIKEHREDDTIGISYLSLGIIAAVNLALIALAPEVVAVFAPSAYYEAIWVIPPVSMSAIFIFSYDLFSSFAFYYEKTKFIAGASVVSALLNIILNAIFIPAFGYYAAGYTTLVCYMAYAAAHYFCMRHICKTNGHNENYYNPRVLLAIYIGFVLCGFLLSSLYTHPIIRYSLILLALITALIFRKQIFALLRRIRSLRKEENGGASP